MVCSAANTQSNFTNNSTSSAVTKYYNFVSNIECDEKNTGQGQAKIINVTYVTNECTLLVKMSHAAGCPKFSTYGFNQFLIEYPWILGILYLMLGPIMGLYGKKLFP